MNSLWLLITSCWTRISDKKLLHCSIWSRCITSEFRCEVVYNTEHQSVCYLSLVGHLKVIACSNTVAVVLDHCIVIIIRNGIDR